jgi:hypothetical protein
MHERGVDPHRESQAGVKRAHEQFLIKHRYGGNGDQGDNAHSKNG